MPCYEYECRNGHITEKVFNITSAPKKIKCWCGEKAHKIISNFHFGNSPEFKKKWHPEELNAKKDIEHWQKKHGKSFWDV